MYGAGRVIGWPDRIDRDAGGMSESLQGVLSRDDGVIRGILNR